MRRHEQHELDPRVVKRAAEAWKRANALVWKGKRDRNRALFEGDSADAIIERAAPFRRDPELYAAYETAVRAAAYAEIGRPKVGRRPQVTEAEHAEARRLVRMGVHIKEVAERLGRSAQTISRLTRGAA